MARARATASCVPSAGRAVAEWGGVPLSRLVDLVRPKPEVTHVVFYAMDDKGRYGHFYEAVPIFLTRHTQALLALEMNGAPLAVEFVDDISTIGMGQGSYREDQLHYANAAGI